MALVELKNVSKIYQVGDEEIRALDNITLDIESGEFISIIGPSGSGKSTLMHLLGCLDTPTHGTLTLDGIQIQNASPMQLAAIRNRKIGFVFQTSIPLAHNASLPLVTSFSNSACLPTFCSSIEVLDFCLLELELELAFVFALF